MTRILKIRFGYLDTECKVRQARCSLGLCPFLLESHWNGAGGTDPGRGPSQLLVPSVLVQDQTSSYFSIWLVSFWIRTVLGKRL